MTPAPAPHRNRWQIETTDDAIQFLCKKARNAFKALGRPHILVVGGPDAMTRAIHADLAARGMTPVVVTLEALQTDGAPPAAYACVICSYTDIRRTTVAARIILADKRLSLLTFEYVTFPQTSYGTLIAHQHETALDKVSPLPTYSFDPFALYEASLAHFEKKCDIRDYMDVCQLLKGVKDNGVPGDIAEFGAYRGHSGYLLASLMNAFGMEDKRLILFDTFEAFPEEPLGIDRFWSRSHPVDFEAVRRKFRPFPFVTFVKGDFTHTLDAADLEQLAFVYVDCDAYRSSAFLMHHLFPQVLAPGGVMIFEDYGHAQLLGNRAAVHDYFENRTGCIQFFSQFSGCYIVVKLVTGA